MISKNKIIVATKSKDGKAIVNNFAWLSILQVASYIFPLITIPYLARVIGLDKFGEIAFATAIITYFQTFVDWGFSFTATRDVARNRDDNQKLSEIFSNVIWSKLILLAVSSIILCTLICIIPIFRENYLIILITFLLIPGQIMFPDWFFQGIEKMKFISILNLLSKLLFTILIFVFINRKEDFIYQPLFTSLGFIVSGVISFYIIINRWKIKVLKPNIKIIITTIKNSSDVFINQLAPNLYNSFSVLLLGFYGGNSANGKLDAGAKFINITSQFFGIISRSIFPHLSRKLDNHIFFVKVSLTLAFICTIILFFGAPLIVKIFYTPEFESSISVIRIMSFSVIFLCLCNLYGTNYLIIKGKEKELRNITLVCSFIGLFLSIPLVYYYSFIGAALSITVTRGLLGLTSMYFAKFK